MKSVNADAFFASYHEVFDFPSPEAYEQLEHLLARLEADDMTSRREAAYMLATIKHECADTFRPIEERGTRDYFDRYEPGTPTGKRLGNTFPGDGYTFRGRGYIQITGRANYAKFDALLGMPLLDNPSLVLGRGVAYRIMTYGMHHGSFTGKRLSDYIVDERIDYVNARRIINGLDQAVRIASYAERFFACLERT